MVAIRIAGIEPESHMPAVVDDDPRIEDEYAEEELAYDAPAVQDDKRDMWVALCVGGLCVAVMAIVAYLNKH